MCVHNRQNRNTTERSGFNFIFIVACKRPVIPWDYYLVHLCIFLILFVSACWYSNQFKCGSGECIYDYYRCDGRVHCRDGSDEICSLYSRLMFLTNSCSCIYVSMLCTIFRQFSQSSVYYLSNAMPSIGQNINSPCVHVSIWRLSIWEQDQFWADIHQIQSTSSP